MKTWIIVAITLGLALFVSRSASGEPLGLIVPLQGTLTDAAGAPRSGEVELTVELFDDPIAGARVYAEQQLVVLDAGGSFTMYLGGEGDLQASVFRAHPDLYVQVTADGEPFFGRVPLGTVPYAARADYAPVCGLAESVSPEAFDDFEIGAGAVKGSMIGSDAITRDKIANAAVGGAQLAAGAVAGAHVADGSLTGVDIAAGSIGSAHIADLSVTADDLADGAVRTRNLASGVVGSAALARGAVGTLQIANGAVTGTQVAEHAIAGSHVAHETLHSWHIAPDSIGQAELSPDAVRAEHIATDAVGAPELAPNSVGYSEIQTDAVRSAELANGAVTGPHLSNAALQLVTPVEVSRYNDAGTTRASLGSTHRRICFLASMTVYETDSMGEAASCRVVISQGTWYVEAYLGKSDDADVKCIGRCFSW